MEKKKRLPLTLALLTAGLFFAVGIACFGIIGNALADGYDASVGENVSAKIIPLGPIIDGDGEPPKEIEILEHNPDFDILSNTVKALAVVLWILFSLSVAALVALTVLGILQKKGIIKTKDAKNPKEES